MSDRQLFEREVGQFFRDLLTRPNWTNWIIVILLPITLQWAATASYELVVRALENHVKFYLWVSIFPFLAILGLSYRAAKRFSESRQILHNPVSDLDARVLILFLSPIDRDAETVNAVFKEPDSLDLRELKTRQRFGGSWRMPLEAIAYHLRNPDRVTLHHLMVITSPETSGMFADFKKLVEKLTPGVGLQIDHIANFNDGAYAGGVNFVDPRLLEEAIEHAYAYFRRKGIRERDVLVDITGGKKTVSIVGALVALKEARRIQYVEPNYEVRFFDLEYVATDN